MITINNCQKCGYQWAQRKDKQSRVCPDCRSTAWNGSHRKQSRWNFDLLPGESRDYREPYDPEIIRRFMPAFYYAKRKNKLLTCEGHSWGWRVTCAFR